MTTLTKRTALTVFIPLALSLLSVDAHAQRGYDCAHGPDTWRVRNVANWDQLNIRSGPELAPQCRRCHSLQRHQGPLCRALPRQLVPDLVVRHSGLGEHALSWRISHRRQSHSGES